MLHVQLKDGNVHVALPGHMRAICGAERVRNDDVVSSALPDCPRCVELVDETLEVRPDGPETDRGGLVGQQPY